MQVSVENTGDLERRMRVEVPAEDIEKEIESRLRSYGKTAKIKGFRPGKVPMKVIRRQYGSQVRAEVVNDVMRSSFARAVTQEQLRPAGGPRIEAEGEDEGDGLAYVATFEVYPEIELHGLDSLAVERITAPVEDGDVERVLENLREQRAEWNPVERSAAAGDQLTVDFAGALDGEPVEGASGEGHSFVLGSGQMLEGFEAGLAGASAGDHREFPVDFPEDYRAEDLAGKTLHFEADVKQVAEKSLPEIDDDFCLAYGITEGGVGKLREDVRENMTREMDRKSRADLKSRLLDALALANPVQVPQSLVQEETHRMLEDIKQRHQVSDEHLPAHEQLEPQALKRVQLGLLINEVISHHELVPDSARVEARLQELASEYPDPEHVARASRGNAEVMRSIESYVLEEQVVDALLETATVNERTVPFNELMQG
ncbi:MAG: trigger factor [Pseudomonadota bacterium]